MEKKKILIRCARNNNFTHKEMFIIGEAIKEIKQQRENEIKK